MRAFIIRPFSTRNGIDFEQVEQHLIAPTLKLAGIGGGTTLEIMGPGNIRADLFQLLLTADIVIADITLHNANVYYELGIRHALRGRITILLRGVAWPDQPLAADSVPFDLLTDRYLTYPLAAPQQARDALLATIQRAQAAQGQDSPVFRLLPKLSAPPVDRFLALPLGFEEAVERALQRLARSTSGADRRGLLLGDLALLAQEAQFFDWAAAGLRLVGRAQFDANHREGARATWEAVRRYEPLDLEANHRLCTLYQKLGDLPASTAAAERVLAHPQLAPAQQAEIHSLRASNLKAQWLQSLAGLPAGSQRGEAALRSSLLGAALAAYEQGFKADRNHYYSAINALALLVLQRELARQLPETWELTAGDDSDGEAAATRARDQIDRRIALLTAGVVLALERASEFDPPEHAVWHAFTKADLCCLTSDRPPQVALAYHRALESDGTSHAFALSSARAQLLMLESLGVLPANVGAGLGAFGPLPAEPAQTQGRVLLFTGHRVDDQDRQAKGRPARFPRTAEAEAAALQAIRSRIERLQQSPQGVALGLAGGASGGDILFHEACAALAVPSWLYLALPPAPYKERSVRGGGDGWLQRFDHLVQARDGHTRLMTELQGEDDARGALPPWLVGQKHYDIWQRSNLWLLQSALACGPRRVTLIALWDGEIEGDGPGGTSHLVQLAREHGAEVDLIDTRALFQLP